MEVQMNAVNLHVPGISLKVHYAAIYQAYVFGTSFTVEALCKKYGLKPNRHTRRALNEMVKADVLYKAKRLFEDGHYRMVYAGQFTKRWEGL